MQEARERAERLVDLAHAVAQHARAEGLLDLFEAASDAVQLAVEASFLLRDAQSGRAAAGAVERAHGLLEEARAAYRHVRDALLAVRPRSGPWPDP